MLKKNEVQVMFIILVVIFYSGICVAEEKLLRDTWYIIELDGKPIGYSFLQFFQVDNGYVYDIDQMYAKNFSGGLDRFTQHTKWKVNQEFEFQSIEYTRKSSHEQTKLKAEYSNGKINIISTDQNGDEINISWKTKEKIYLIESFIDYLFFTGNVQLEKQYIEKCWISLSNKPEITAFWIEETPIEYNGKTFPGFKILVDSDLVTIVDHSGEIYSSGNTDQYFVIRKVEKDEIFYFKCLALDLLMVPGNIPIAHPYRSSNSQIRVRWREVADDQFNWIDNRQELVENTHSDGTHEVLLKIQKDNRDFTNKITLPVTDKAFLPYLTETEFIHPSVPEVKELLKEIVGNEDDGWTVTQKLVKWVYKFLRYEPLILTLTTEEILDRKRGNCVEHAVLFASLARSAGLPTRLVLGERYEADTWTGHMWNEVWLGEWIAVDPSHRQISPDALLLKFVDSDSVMGTQIVQRGLIGQLDIEIIDAKFSSEDDIIINTGINAHIYSNADYQCQITCPESWRFAQLYEGDTTMHPVNEQNVQGHLWMSRIPNETTLEQLLERQILDLKDNSSELSIIDQQSAILANKPAVYTTLTFVNQGVLVRQQKWIIINEDEDQYYHLTFTANDELWDDYETYFQEILDSFRID